VILATGGIGAIFGRSTNSVICTYRIRFQLLGEKGGR